MKNSKRKSRSRATFFMAKLTKRNMISQKAIITWLAITCILPISCQYMDRQPPLIKIREFPDYFH